MLHSTHRWRAAAPPAGTAPEGSASWPRAATRLHRTRRGGGSTGCLNAGQACQGRVHASPRHAFPHPPGLRLLPASPDSSTATHMAAMQRSQCARRTRGTSGSAADRSGRSAGQAARGLRLRKCRCKARLPAAALPPCKHRSARWHALTNPTRGARPQQAAAQQRRHGGLGQGAARRQAQRQPGRLQQRSAARLRRLLAAHEPEGARVQRKVALQGLGHVLRGRQGWAARTTAAGLPAKGGSWGWARGAG